MIAPNDSAGGTDVADLVAEVEHITMVLEVAVADNYILLRYL